MSRIKEILNELFSEMVKEGDDIARNEYNIAGIDFIFKAEISTFMDIYDEKIIKEYKKSNYTPPIMPGEKRKVEDTEVDTGEKSFFYLTWCEKQGLFIHEYNPAFDDLHERWSSAGFTYRMDDPTKYERMLTEKKVDYLELKMTQLIFNEEVRMSTQEMRN